MATKRLLSLVRLWQASAMTRRTMMRVKMTKEKELKCTFGRSLLKRAWKSNLRLDSEGCVKPHSRGHRKRDLLSFRIEVAELLIGTYRGRKRAGRKRKRYDDRLDPTLQHLPIYGDSFGDDVVRTKKGEAAGLSREVYCHHCHFQCSYCNVHLCRP